MAVTWTISTLERNTDDGVVVAHWRASDADGEHSGSSYGTCGFTPDADADGYTAYADITETQAIEWVKADVDADAVEASIAAQIADSKAPAISTGVPW
jgi:cytochrome c1